MHIRSLRQERNETLAQLAEAVGVDLSTISRIERGVQEPSIGVARAISAHFSVTMDSLFGEKPMEKEQMSGGKSPDTNPTKAITQ